MRRAHLKKVAVESPNESDPSIKLSSLNFADNKHIQHNEMILDVVILDIGCGLCTVNFMM